MKLKMVLLFLLYCAFLQGQSQSIKIDLLSKNHNLDAKFFSGSNNSAPTIVLLHGFPGNQNCPLDLAENLTRKGYHTLVFNYEGSYSSEGTFSFENCINNVDASINFLYNPDNIKKYNIDTSRIIVCGYSFGGGIALESAITNKKIKYVISVAGPDHAAAIRKTEKDPEYQKAYYNSVSRSFEPNGPFRGNLDTIFVQNKLLATRLDPVKNAETLKDKKILFIIGWLDLLCPMEENALPVYRKLIQFNPQNFTMIGFEDDHRFLKVRNNLAESISEWIVKL